MNSNDYDICEVCGIIYRLFNSETPNGRPICSDCACNHSFIAPTDRNLRGPALLRRIAELTTGLHDSEMNGWRPLLDACGCELRELKDRLHAILNVFDEAIRKIAVIIPIPQDPPPAAHAATESPVDPTF